MGAPDAVPRPPGDHRCGDRALPSGGSRMTPGRFAPSRPRGGGPASHHPDRGGVDRGDAGYDLAGTGGGPLRAAAGGARGDPGVPRDRSPPPVHPRRRSPRASESVRREAARRERDRRPLRAPDLRDGRREPGVPQRGPRDLRPGGRGDPPLPVLLQPRDGDHPRLRGSRARPRRRTAPAGPSGDRRGDHGEDARDRHRVAEQPDRGGLPAGDAGGDPPALRGARDLPRQRRGVRIFHLRRRPALLPRLPRRGARDLPLQPLQGVRDGELAGRVPRGAGAPAPRPHEDPGHGRRQRAGDLPVRGTARDARGARILRVAPPFPRESAERGPCAPLGRSGPGGGPPRDGRLLPVREGDVPG